MLVCRYFVYFIIYSFLGWIYETCYCTIHEKTWENRGFLYGPCIPLYGVGATLAQILFVDVPRICLNTPAPSYQIIFIGCAVGSFFLEYGTSYVLERRFHARWWDYTDLPLNINGRVCLPFTFLFGIAGIIVTQIIIPPVVEGLSYIPNFAVELLALIFMFIFGMDMALTISALTTFAKEFERINEQINKQMTERIEAWQANRVDAKVARIEKVNGRKEAAFVKKELNADKLAELKEQLSTEAVKQWILNATETQRGQFRHIAKFTHPVASTKALLDKGSEFLRTKKK
ncbi:putative ABC transporter permease [Pseudobutyrivibrio xylanivorans]|uniref:ABC transporter permease n=1 Tax=Pseudobutyrivibrio xylanivorans TaxID=185007 RepID=A0A5P6VT01_PSEXY|nr:putative ABC transporter permease [Pseudobutyrivibrio xylanivorans]QFJ55726.1 putative ABC transporter permease [Pseudobutyrivibrio xylanivorans]